jgi:LysM repeat protein
MKMKLPGFPGFPKRGSAVHKRPARLKLKAAVARAPSRRVIARDDEDDYYDGPEPNMKLSHAFVVVLVLHVIAVAGVFAFNTIKARQSAGASIIAAETINRSVESHASNVELPRAPAAGNPQPAEKAAPGVAPSAAAQAAGGRTHEIKAGENLTRISVLYGVSIEAIQAENAIVDPATIRAGQVLRIPAKSTAANNPPPVQPVANKAQAAQPTQQKAAASPPAVAPESRTKPAAPSKDTEKVYVVVKGDNPVAIAKKLGVSYNELMTLNKIEDPRTLQIGQKLKVPPKRTN